MHPRARLLLLRRLLKQLQAQLPQRLLQHPQVMFFIFATIPNVEESVEIKTYNVTEVLSFGIGLRAKHLHCCNADCSVASVLQVIRIECSCLQAN